MVTAVCVPNAGASLKCTVVKVSLLTISVLKFCAEWNIAFWSSQCWQPQDCELHISLLIVCRHNGNIQMRTDQECRNVQRGGLERQTFGWKFVLRNWTFNPLTPNDHYSGRTTQLTSKRYILYIYSTNIGTEYFKRGIYCPFFSLQNAVCFIILTYLVPVLFTFHIQGVLKLKKNNSGAKNLKKP